MVGHLWVKPSGGRFFNVLALIYRYLVDFLQGEKVQGECIK